jgi:hypothetical protein
MRRIVYTDEEVKFYNKHSNEFKEVLFSQMMYSRPKYDQNNRRFELMNFFEDMDVSDIHEFRMVNVNHLTANDHIEIDCEKERLKFLKMNTQKTKYVNFVHGQLVDERKDIIDKLKQHLIRMLLSLSKTFGIVKHTNKTHCKVIQDLCSSFRSCKTREDAKKFWNVYYNFDNVLKNWKIDVATRSMIDLRWTYYPKVIKGYRPYTFAEKLATFVITQLRKMVNAYGKTGTPGFTINNVGKKDVFLEENIVCMHVSLFLPNMLCVIFCTNPNNFW